MIKKVAFSEPIRIDQVEIKKDQYFSNAYIIDLPLDSVPDHVWQDIFEQKWKSSKHLWDRKLFVVGNKLRLITSPNSMEEKLDWVKEIVKETNLGIEEFNREVEGRSVEISRIKERLTIQILEEEKRIVEMIRDLVRQRFRTL